MAAKNKIVMQMYEVWYVPASEYAKADADANYSPREESTGYIYAPSEAEAEAQLLRKIKAKQLPRGSMLRMPD